MTESNEDSYRHKKEHDHFNCRYNCLNSGQVWRQIKSRLPAVPGIQMWHSKNKFPRKYSCESWLILSYLFLCWPNLACLFCITNETFFCLLLTRVWMSTVTIWIRNTWNLNHFSDTFYPVFKLSGQVIRRTIQIMDISDHKTDIFSSFQTTIIKRDHLTTGHV